MCMCVCPWVPMGTRAYERMRLRVWPHHCTSPWVKAGPMKVILRRGTARMCVCVMSCLLCVCVLCLHCCVCVCVLCLHCCVCVCPLSSLLCVCVLCLHCCVCVCVSSVFTVFTAVCVCVSSLSSLLCVCPLSSLLCVCVCPLSSQGIIFTSVTPL